MAFSITYPLVWQLKRVVSSIHAPTDPHKKWGVHIHMSPRTWKSGGSTDPLDPVVPRPLHWRKLFPGKSNANNQTHTNQPSVQIHEQNHYGSVHATHVDRPGHPSTRSLLTRVKDACPHSTVPFHRPGVLFTKFVRQFLCVNSAYANSYVRNAIHETILRTKNRKFVRKYTHGLSYRTTEIFVNMANTWTHLVVWFHNYNINLFTTVFVNRSITSKLTSASIKCHVT